MHPILFNLSGFTLHTYGLLVAAGFITGIYVARHFARRFGLNPDRIFNLAVYLALAAIVGAKLFLVMQDWRYYLHYPRALFGLGFLESAGIFYGGLIVALIVLVLYIWRQKLNFLTVGDAIVPGLAIGHGIGRMGCFSAGCCWGQPTTLPWGITFNNAYSHATVGVPLGIPLEPTQLMGAVAGLVIFLVLWRVSKHRAFVGQLTAVYLVVYGIWRFLVDFLRYYQPQALLFNGLLTDAQLTSLFMITFGIIIWATQAQRRLPVSTPTSVHA